MSTPIVANCLKKVLADTYTLALKAQNYHWNVVGEDFYQFHKMFEELYKEFLEAVDMLAERIRALKVHAPGTFKEFLELTSLTEAGTLLKVKEMVRTLSEDQQKILKTLESALKAAQEANDEATAHLLADRIFAHQKYAWMLDSTLA